MGGTMRLGADPDQAPRGHAGPRDLRRGGHLRAPPPPLRGQQLPAPAPGVGRAGPLGHLTRRAPGRDPRDRRPPVLRRLAVPPRVQVAAPAAGAAVPRVRRRRPAARAPSAPGRAPRPAARRARTPRPRAQSSSDAIELTADRTGGSRRGEAGGSERPSARDSPARSRSCAGSRARSGASGRAPSGSPPSCARWGSRSRRTTPARRSAATPATCSPGCPALGPHDPALRPSRHGRGAGADRPGDRRRRLGERQRRHPRRRQQGGGRGDARGGAAGVDRGVAGRDRAAVHGVRGERAGRREGVRRPASALGVRLRIRPCLADRRGRHRLAHLLPPRRRVPRPRRARGDPARGRAQRDPRRGARDRGDAARPARPRDDGERRIDHGGVGSTNVVPDRCRLLAETRSLDPERVEAVIAQMVDAVHDGASTAECDVDLVCERLFDGYRPALGPGGRGGRGRAARCGYEPRRIVTGGGSDANALIVAGFECVNLANGTERNHEPTERVSEAALYSMLDVTFALLEEAALVYGSTDSLAWPATPRHPRMIGGSRRLIPRAAGSAAPPAGRRPR